MKKFIEAIRETGDFDAMVKSCITVSTLSRDKEINVPAGAVESMVSIVLKENEELKDLFCDESFNYAISAIVEAIREEVKDVKITPVTSKSVISDLLGILGTVTEAL
jgi:hypothetical protein